MDVGAHVVCGQCPANGINDRIIGWDLGVGERLGGAAQALQMLSELEDLSVVDAQPLPDRVTVLDG